jgi:hypothetical protein
MKMHRKYTIIICLFFLIQFSGTRLVFGQNTRLVLPDSSGEQLQLFTDRSLFGVSEKIYYSVMYSGPEFSGSRSWSKVIYVELINWDGTKIGYSKVPVTDGLASGSVQIPYGISSGNYYLRAYTKWMRNFSPYLYAYTTVKIVNPFSEAIVAGPEKSRNTAEEIVTGNQKVLEGIVVSGLQEVYDKRDMVSMEIELDPAALPGTFSLGVVRAGGFDTPIRASVHFDRTIEQEGEEVVEHLPELYGLSIAGQLVDEISGSPVGETKINLSSVSEPFHFSSDMTDEEGMFLFTLPYKEGLNELHIAPEGDSGREYKLLISGEFCNKNVHLPYVPFSLNNQEREMAQELLLNIQINARFEEVIQSDRQEPSSTPFYGKPASVTYIKDYIELINLEEFFYELIRSVTVSNRGRNPYLIVNSQGSLGMFPPLILMDNIKVKNDKSLLETPARRVERIEVVNRGYVIGKEKYSGIISVFSTTGDMAGLKMENGSRFFNFRLYDIQDPGVSHCDETVEKSAFPDRRITLLWEPGLQFSEEAVTQVRFYTSDVPGEYEIVIRGLDSSNNVLEYRTAAFTVK